MNEKKKESMKTGTTKPTAAGTAAKKPATPSKPAEAKPKSTTTPPKPK